MRKRHLTAILVAASLPSAVLANDSNAALAAGGIVPRQSTTIHLVSESLVISRQKIRVTYRFRNTSNAPQHVLVAFPFARQAVGGDLEGSIPWDRPADIFLFNVQVDGRAIIPRYVMRSFDRDGREVVAGPDNRIPGENRQVDYEAVWEQDYAPHQEVVVTHDYTPIVGSAMSAPSRSTLRRKYCATEIPRDLNPFTATNVRYILMSAKTWAGPIDRFSLTIRFRASRASFTALCGFAMRRTAGGDLTYHARHFTPRQDLDILFLHRVL